MLVVGMFDDADGLEEGLRRLGEAGVDDVQRFEGPPQGGTPGSAGASEGGAQPVDLGRSSEVSSPHPGSTRAAESPRIGGPEIDEQEQAYYERMLREGGRILVAQVDETIAGSAERALEAAGASRVVRHVR